MGKFNFKKLLPLAILMMAVLVVAGIILVVRGVGTKSPVEEEEVVAELPVEQRPVVTLVPRADGHWMDLSVENINVLGASTIEYEFTYLTSDGRSQGTGGVQPFTVGDDFTSEILIGTTSSGKFYYDEGVESGDLTLKFRNESGKLVARLTTSWIFKYEPEAVEFGGFTFTPEQSEKVYFVAMNTFGLPNAPEGVLAGPVGIFSSEEVEGNASSSSGRVLTYLQDSWQVVDTDSGVSSGIFISSN